MLVDATRRAMLGYRGALALLALLALASDAAGRS
jgi:hypothetical protein